MSGQLGDDITRDRDTKRRLGHGKVSLHSTWRLEVVRTQGGPQWYRMHNPSANGAEYGGVATRWSPTAAHAADQFADCMSGRREWVDLSDGPADMPL